MGLRSLPLALILLVLAFLLSCAAPAVKRSQLPAEPRETISVELDKYYDNLMVAEWYLGLAPLDQVTSVNLKIDNGYRDNDLIFSYDPLSTRLRIKFRLPAVYTIAPSAGKGERSSLIVSGGLRGEVEISCLEHYHYLAPKGLRGDVFMPGVTRRKIVFNPVYRGRLYDPMIVAARNIHHLHYEAFTGLYREVHSLKGVMQSSLHLKDLVAQLDHEFMAKVENPEIYRYLNALRHLEGFLLF